MVWWKDISDQNKDLHLKDLHAWSEAIANTHYPLDKQGNLAYLDIDSDHYVQWGETIDGASEETLVECVKKNMAENPRHLFREFFTLGLKWEAGISDGEEIDENGLVTPPPVLPLLATWSIAAENMKADEKMAANNFYGQLHRLYSEDIELEDLHKSYIEHAEYFWRLLNNWLEKCEGNRGLPTAYTSSSLKHVGVARSQALIRDQDRVVLYRMFVSKGFSAHQAMPVDDMERLLKQWLTAPDGPSKNLLRVFNSDSKTISELAVEELKAWDGSGSTEESSSFKVAQKLLLTATLGGFPTRKLGLSLTAPGNDLEKLFVETQEDGLLEDNPLEFRPESKGRLVLSEEVTDFDSVLEGLVNLKNEIKHLQRIPRSLVPLQYDDLLGKYIETESVSLAGKCILLCRENFANKVGIELERIAQEGFKREDNLDGLPSKWTLFSEVRVLGSGVNPELLKTESDKALYGVLEPDSSSAINIEGGFILPGGGSQTWSLLSLPNLLVSNDKGAPQKIKISRQDSSDKPIEIQSPDPIWGANLSRYNLSEGNYFVESFEGNKRTSFSRKSFRLRDADTPALVLRQDFFHFGHSSEDLPFSIFGSKREQGSELLPLSGAFLMNVEIPEVSGGLNEIIPQWWGNSDGTSLNDEWMVVSSGVALGDIDYPDCVKEGNHHWVLERAQKGQSWVASKCKKCKRESTERAWRVPARRQSNKNSNNQAAQLRVPNFNSTNFADLQGSPEKRSLLNIAIDALSYQQQGGWSSFLRIANQVGSSALEVSNFWRALVALGHIEITRDHLMQPEYWAITPPVLAGVSNGRYALTGFRCRKLLEELQYLVQENGGDFSENPQAFEVSRGGPDVIYVEGLDEKQLRHIAEEVSKVLPRNIPQLTVQPKIGLRLASTLPRLSAVLENCDAEIVPPVPGEISKYNPITTKYDPVGAATVPGSYKFTQYSNVYAYRTEHDIKNNRRRRVDAYIMKYAAALLDQCPLLGFDGKNKLYVPIGADLPGLYGRTAVLSSGQLPQVQDNMLVYSDISPEIAYLLSDKLEN